MHIIKYKFRRFVEPRYHLPKTQDAISVGILSPFSYDFSTISLGPLSIYHAINRDSNCPGIADRIFTYDPLLDESGNILSNLELQQKLPTFEKRIPLNKLNLICISLTNTDAVTKALQLLQLGGIPLKKSDRQSGNYPLILAGGPGCVNPEIFADFFDFFSIGDGCVLAKNIVNSIHILLTQNKKSICYKCI